MPTCPNCKEVYEGFHICQKDIHIASGAWADEAVADAVDHAESDEQRSEDSLRWDDEAEDNETDSRAV